MATFQQYTLIPAEIASRVCVLLLYGIYMLTCNPQLPENISFDEGASIPAALTTAAVGLYNDKEGALGLGLEYPWLPEGRHKYSNKPFFVLGGSSSVGQFGRFLPESMSRCRRSDHYRYSHPVRQTLWVFAHYHCSLARPHALPCLPRCIRRH